MKRRLLALLLLMLGLSFQATAQDAVSYLLARTNSLRASRDLPSLTIHPSLSAAANNHARWMAENNLVEHTQFDGSGVRNRAPNAGFPSSWVGENIYLGSSSSPEGAWIWWLNSPVHYAGLVSPNWDSIGIGRATAGGRTAYVLVFGNAIGRLSGAVSGNSSSGSAAAQPAFILGLDEVGNIKHEVQPGHTIGDIALIYGYTWDDIPAMLELNDLTTDDIRWLQPGSVFLVPPKAGTFTPTSPAPTATATSAATARPAPRLTDTPAASTVTPEAAFAATRELRIEFVPSQRETPLPAIGSTPDDNSQSIAQLLALGAAILVQLGVLGVASLALLRRST